MYSAPALQHELLADMPHAGVLSSQSQLKRKRYSRISRLPTTIDAQRARLPILESDAVSALRHEAPLGAQSHAGFDKNVSQHSGLGAPPIAAKPRRRSRRSRAANRGKVAPKNGRDIIIIMMRRKTGATLPRLAAQLRRDQERAAKKMVARVRAQIPPSASCPTALPPHL